MLYADFGFLMSDFALIMENIAFLIGNISKPLLEGTIFPDTYFFQRNDDKNIIISRIQ